MEVYQGMMGSDPYENILTDVVMSYHMKVVISTTVSVLRPHTTLERNGTYGHRLDELSGSSVVCDESTLAITKSQARMFPHQRLVADFCALSIKAVKQFC